MSLKPRQNVCIGQSRQLINDVEGCRVVEDPCSSARILAVNQSTWLDETRAGLLLLLHISQQGRCHTLTLPLCAYERRLVCKAVTAIIVPAWVSASRSLVRVGLVTGAGVHEIHRCPIFPSSAAQSLAEIRARSTKPLAILHRVETSADGLSRLKFRQHEQKHTHYETHHSHLLHILDMVRSIPERNIRTLFNSSSLPSTCSQKEKAHQDYVSAMSCTRSLRILVMSEQNPGTDMGSSFRIPCESRLRRVLTGVHLQLQR
ncbi:hypothetical protein Mapa_013039 [Marchantia paleacea]|nr:hypothetical protein Mapa_013039 [Marchantia paleacea]